MRSVAASVVAVVVLSLAGGLFGMAAAAAVTPSARAVSAGATDSCAVVLGGKVVCWGYNSAGSLGDGTTTNASTPVEVKGISTAIAVSVGGVHTCALLSGGTIQCWGSNVDGELGNGTTSIVTSTPVTVSSISTATAVSTDGSSSCALLSGGTVKCWGIGSYDRLGNGTYRSSSTPVAVRLG